MDAAKEAYAWLSCYDVVLGIHKRILRKWTDRHFGSRIDAKIPDGILDDIVFDNVNTVADAKQERNS